MALSPFFKLSKVNDIISALSLFAFYKYINNPNCYLETIRVKMCRNHQSNRDRFNKYHDLYSFYILDGQYESFEYLDITTEKHFISYCKDGKEHKPACCRGIDNICKTITADIIDIFEKRLFISGLILQINILLS